MHRQSITPGHNQGKVKVDFLRNQQINERDTGIALSIRPPEPAFSHVP
jgi:hypothetical protein